MKSASFAPCYAALYPALTEFVRTHGYALAIHGSMQRDFDVVCIPWCIDISNPQIVIDEMIKQFDIRKIGKFHLKTHKRLVHTISIGYGECALDLSFVNIDDSILNRLDIDNG